MKVEAKMEVEVTDKDIDDIVCAALEGGITYWADSAAVVGNYLGHYAHEQIARGGKLEIHVIETFDDDDTENYYLDKTSLLRGISMYLSNPERPYNITEVKKHGLMEKPELELDTCNVDGCVADMIVQYALFDEQIYG